MILARRGSMGIHYKTVQKASEVTLDFKKSKFIATVRAVKTEEEARSFIDEMRKKYYDATHNVFAYIVGLDQEVKRYSDDGEPSGTAGLPVLDVIERGNLKNVAVVVTRYFGGTLLGTGGLVKAYGQTAKEGVEAAEIVEMVTLTKLKVVVDYHLMGKVQNEIMNQEHIIYDTIFEDRVTFILYVYPIKVEELEKSLIDITSANIEIQALGESLLMKKGNTILF